MVAARANFTHDLWLTPMSGAKALTPSVPITVGALAANPSVASTGRIAYATLAAQVGLWKLPLDVSTGRVTGEMQRLWRENVRAGYAYVSANGKKLAYASNRSGDPDIWVRDLESGAERQLTSSKFDEVRGVLSPDGKLVAIWRPKARIYTIPSDGGEEKLVCEECGLVNAWSADGKKLLFQDVASGRRFASLDLATGRQQDLPGFAMSPDGRWVAGARSRNARRELFVAPVTDGGSTKPVRIAEGAAGPVGLYWSPDGNVLYYFLEDTLWARKLDATKAPVGEPIVVKRFSGRDRPTFSANCVTKDGIYFTMQEMRANVWIAEPESR